MTSNFPGGLDNLVTTRTDSTPNLTIHATDHNNYADAINKIEAELGINPSGSFATVDARFVAAAAAGTAPAYSMQVVSPGHYQMYDRHGTLIEDRTDTATTSALKYILETRVHSGDHVHFGPGRFHLLDAPLGTEAWANTETKLNFVDLQGVTISGEGMYTTTISTYTNTTSASPDVATMLFTRCSGWTLRDFTLELCGVLVTTMETFNGNQATDFRLERIRVTRSKGRGIVMDGGDAGAYAGRNVVHNCIVQGRPRRAELLLIAGGTLSPSTTYRYAYSWTDSDLLGVGLPGETQPSDPVSLDTSVGSKSIRLYIETGPYTCTARNIYRWSAASGWKFIHTVADNTTTNWTDDGTSTPSTPGADFTAHRSTIYQAGYELLSCLDSTISNSIADGVGDVPIGVNQYGFNIVRKGTHQQPDRNRINGCIAIGCAKAGFRIFGGSENIVSNCTTYNSGLPSVYAQFFRVEGTPDTPTRNNIFSNIVGIDDRDATSPDGGVGVNNAFSIVTGTIVPNGTVINSEIFRGNLAGITDAGTNTRQYSRSDHVHTALGALVVAEPLFIPGRYYGPKSDLPFTSNAGVAILADVMYGSPFYCTKDITISDFAIQITAGVGTKCRIGVYAANETDGLWDVRMAQSGDLSSATGTVTWSSGGVSFLAHKRYWWTFLADGALSIMTITPTVSLLGYGSALSFTKNNGILKTIGAGWGSMPGSGPAAPSYNNTVVVIDGLAT